MKGQKEKVLAMQIRHRELSIESTEKESSVHPAELKKRGKTISD
jgi:hypothetical protein